MQRTCSDQCKSSILMRCVKIVSRRESLRTKKEFWAHYTSVPFSAFLSTVSHSLLLKCSTIISRMLIWLGIKLITAKCVHISQPSLQQPWACMGLVKNNYGSSNKEIPVRNTDTGFVFICIKQGSDVLPYWRSQYYSPAIIGQKLVCWLLFDPRTTCLEGPVKLH